MISLKNFAQKSHLFARMSEAAYQSPEQNRDYFARLGMVTKLPTFPYWHSGQMFYIDGAGNVKNMSLAGRVVDQLTATMRGLFHGTAIPLADHSISRYAAHLEKYQETGRD